MRKPLLIGLGVIAAFFLASVVFIHATTGDAGGGASRPAGSERAPAAVAPPAAPLAGAGEAAPPDAARELSPEEQEIVNRAFLPTGGAAPVAPPQAPTVVIPPGRKLTPLEKAGLDAEGEEKRAAMRRARERRPRSAEDLE
jgi:hypothetical protein